VLRLALERGGAVAEVPAPARDVAGGEVAELHGERGLAGARSGAEVGHRHARPGPEQHPHRAAVEAALVVLVGPDGEIDGAVTVHVAERRAGDAEVVVRQHQAAEATEVRADLLVVGHVPGRVELQHPDCARVRAAVVVADRAHEQVLDAVPVEVVGGERDPEAIALAEHAREAAQVRADLGEPLHAAVRVQRQHEHAPRLERVVAEGPHRDVLDPVAVQVAEQRHVGPEAIARPQHRAEGRRVGRQAARRLDRAVAAQLEQVHRAVVAQEVRLAAVVARGADGEVDHPVAVQVADRLYRPAEGILLVERDPEAAARLADLLLRLDGPVGIQEQHVHRAVVETAVVVAIGSDGDVGRAVEIEVAQRAGRDAEAVVVLDRTDGTARHGRDLVARLHRAVGVEHQEPDGSALDPPAVGAVRARQEIADAVAVEVAQVRHADAEAVVVAEDRPETPALRGELLLAQDRAVLGRARARGQCQRERNEPGARPSRARRNSIGMGHVGNSGGITRRPSARDCQRASVHQ
jgi:hypothetical protein